jgi:hypothetical protein
MLFLLCSHAPHYLWVGGAFAKQLRLGNAGDIIRFAASVTFIEDRWNGQVTMAPSDITVIRAGFETESFWASFSSGY